MHNLSLVRVSLTDQSQNQYLRKASETWDAESKAVELKWLWTTNMQNTSTDSDVLARLNWFCWIVLLLFRKTINVCKNKCNEHWYNLLNWSLEKHLKCLRHFGNWVQLTDDHVYDSSKTNKRINLWPKVTVDIETEKHSESRNRMFVLASNCFNFALCWLLIFSCWLKSHTCKAQTVKHTSHIWIMAMTEA